MEVLYLASFLKDVKKLKNKQLKERLKKVLLELEQTKSLAGFAQVKKLQGHPFAYRIRIGDYRLGLFCDEKKIEIARFVKRNDIYKLFP